MEAYLIIDIGTGNVRVAAVDVSGEILAVERDNVHYHRDEHYPDALYFEPVRLWDQVIALTRQVLGKLPGISIKALTASSQREGVVLLDEKGHALTGMPNHDHRGREWEGGIEEKDRIYDLTGRYPSSLFSAMKLAGLRERRPELWKKTACMLSISDWAQYQLSGVAGYEHSQASETLLYDVSEKTWSEELCRLFGIDSRFLPGLKASGSILGGLLPEYAAELDLPPDLPVVAGGADTQLAIKSTRPRAGDVVIVSGTTTPVVKLVREYTVDEKQRTWTNRHIEEGLFVLETNAGVTGLNYQRLKEIFYPNEGYEVMEAEMADTALSGCAASLGSLIAGERSPLTKGGFLLNAPVSHELTRACFVKSTLWDIACCVAANYADLHDVSPHDQDFVWACGGGMQSPTLRQFLADLLNKEIRIRRGFRQASVAGAALVCRQALGIATEPESAIEVIQPRASGQLNAWYETWKQTRAAFRNIQKQ